MKDLGTFIRTNVYPLALMLLAPPGVQLLWVLVVHHQGSISSALQTSPSDLWDQFPACSWRGAELAAYFLLMQLFLLVAVPHSKFTAIPTPMGNRPTYRINGVLCYLITHLALGGAHYMGWWRYSEVHDEFGPMLAVLNVFALIATVLLYIRGLVSPTNSDSGRTGHGIIWDMWQGTELHPEIFGVSLKQLINCRFAMMGWSVLIVAFALKQVERDGVVANSTVVSLALQLLYIFKFFWWEAGYFNSVDIIHDRFGFYIFWGCTAYLPSLYTITSFYLSVVRVDLPMIAANVLFGVGSAALWANYDTDRQRQAFRAVKGAEKIWGRAPRIVRAKYTTGDGVKRESLLLASGWWGVSRHANYVFEITLALCWSLPAAGTAILPYSYVIFLTILLTDRAYRDELRCAEKYGAAYEEYCRLVPYRMIPMLY